VPDLAGIYVAGDWVGPEGMLADASLASGQAAGAAAAVTDRLTVAT
jgi:pyruvate/2-oxoglutarate dehydrogenase complex dihydrolipoamide dehydrogenase (E3) component